jgi:UDP:flavonoid glycosyltransferase YjiC (YdhE family)
MSAMLATLAAEADLLVTGVAYQELAANVAEYRDIPLATVLWFPIRVNGRLLENVPAPLIRSAMRAYEWLVWRGVKKVEGAQRSELGLPPATGHAPRRIADRGSLEIQAYDAFVFPGLAAEWAKWGARRPFVGMLTLELPTDSDEDVLSWIAEGTPPIFFGFGSIPVGSATDTLAVISAACAQLGERALVCAGGTDSSQFSDAKHVKIVDTVNYSTVFPHCRAVVHHGGAGTTAAGLRAGIPTLILWNFPDQPVSGAALKRLKVGTSRRFSATTERTLTADLRQILAPEYATRARELAAQTSGASASESDTAALVENFARSQRVG